MGKYDPAPVESFYLDRNRLLGMVLADQSLADTHYTSLVMKEFLDKQGLLEGPLVVASFPESGEMTEHALSQLLQSVSSTKGESKDIQLFMNQGIQERIGSILVADPDEVSREFVRLRLEIKGYKVEEAKDGQEALEKYRAMDARSSHYGVELADLGWLSAHRQNP